MIEQANKFINLKKPDNFIKYIKISFITLLLNVINRMRTTKISFYL
jgi:hypothetical protein